LIEMLAVLGIIVILSGLVFYSVSGFKNRQLLEAETRQVVAILEEARSLTLSGQGGNVYGVHFLSNQIIRFAGSAYVGGAAGNVVYPLSSAVSLNSISFNGGGADVVFDKLKGTTLNFGSLDVALTSSASTKKTVFINSTGIIDTK